MTGIAMRHEELLTTVNDSHKNLRCRPSITTNNITGSKNEMKVIPMTFIPIHKMAGITTNNMTDTTTIQMTGIATN